MYTRLCSSCLSVIVGLTVFSLCGCESRPSDADPTSRPASATDTSSAKGSSSKTSNPSDVPAVAVRDNPPHVPKPSEFSTYLAPPKSYDQPGFQITSREFASEWDSDWNSATKKYEGKLLELSGTVVESVRNLGGEYLETLEGGIDGVRCMMQQPNAWLRATKGQTVVLRGILARFAIGKVLIHCRITEVKGAGVPELTADAFSEEFSKDATSARRRYGDNPVLLTGKVKQVTSPTPDLVKIVFDVKGTISIVCNLFYPGAKAESDTVIRVYSRIASVDLGDDSRIELLGIAEERDERNTESGEVTGRNFVSAMNRRPDVTLSAQEFSRKTSNVAENPMAGKLVEVSGRLLRYSCLPGPGHLYLRLDDGESMLGLQCYLRTGAPWDNVMPGQTVTLRGIVSTSQFYPRGYLVNCVIVKTDGPPYKVKTAESIAAEFQAARAKFRMDHFNKSLIIFGEVAKVIRSDSGSVSVELKTSGSASVICEFDRAEREQYASCQVGDTVRLVGLCKPYPNEDMVELISCLFVLGA